VYENSSTIMMFDNFLNVCTVLLSGMWIGVELGFMVSIRNNVRVSISIKILVMGLIVKKIRQHSFLRIVKCKRLCINL